MKKLTQNENPYINIDGNMGFVKILKEVNNCICLFN